MELRARNITDSAKPLIYQLTRPNLHTCLSHDVHVLLVDAVGLEERALVVVGLAVAAADGGRHARAVDVAVVHTWPRSWACREDHLRSAMWLKVDLPD